MTFDPSRPPVLAQTRPLRGGRLRATPDDFLVEEIALYRPSGEGPHVLAFVEKRDLTTPAMVTILARALRVPEAEIGYAGMKDRHAVTRQWISVPGSSPEDVLAVLHPSLRVLEAGRHGNKLRLGHLRGNRFTIRIRDVAPDAREQAEPVLAACQTRGLPNGFGPQRFGNMMRNHLLGGALISGDGEGFVNCLTESSPKDAPDVAAGRSALRDARPRDALRLLPRGAIVERHVAFCLSHGLGADHAGRTLPKRYRSLFVSAWQSAVFNDVLSERLATFDTLLEGDLAMKHENGACFLVEDLAAEIPRATACEISATGPLLGRRTTLPTGAALEVERAVLDRWHANPLPEHSLVPTAVFRGERRALRVPVAIHGTSIGGDGELVLEFTLPRGSFATTLLAGLGLHDGDPEPEEAE